MKCLGEGSHSHVPIPAICAVFLFHVCSHFIQSYQRGHTPNPDILCNKHIKFNALHHHCREKLHVDAIATGHYARVELSAAGSESLTHKFCS